MIRQRWGMRYGLGRNTPMNSAIRQLSFRTSLWFVHTAQLSFLFYGQTKIKRVALVTHLTQAPWMTGGRSRGSPFDGVAPQLREVDDRRMPAKLVTLDPSNVAFSQAMAE